MNELSTAPTDSLIRELKTRFENVVIAGRRLLTNSEKLEYVEEFGENATQKIPIII